MKKDKTVVQDPKDEAPVLRLRHNRFDGFDIYSVEMDGRKTIFHKEAMRSPFIVGGLFKVLGANGDLWLCENIKTKMIHIGPPESIEKSANEEAISSSSPPETDQSA